MSDFIEPKTLEEAQARKGAIGLELVKTQHRLSNKNFMNGEGRRLNAIEWEVARTSIKTRLASLLEENRLLKDWITAHSNANQRVRVDIGELRTACEEIKRLSKIVTSQAYAVATQMTELLHENEALYRRVNELQYGDTTAPDFGREEWRHDEKQDSS